MQGWVKPTHIATQRLSDSWCFNCSIIVLEANWISSWTWSNDAQQNCCIQFCCKFCQSVRLHLCL